MPEDYYIVNRFVTKRLVVKEESGERFFEGILSVEMKDRQGEITIIDELAKCLPIWMDRGGSISDTHSNRIVGKGINYAKVNLTDPEGSILPAIKIIGKIYNHTELDNHIWEQMKNGVYKGLSFGGATRSDRTPIIQGDGSIAYSLKDLELYEVAVCEDPAVPFALITELNPMAKAMIEANKGDISYRSEDKVVIKCDDVGCYVNTPIEKATFGSQAEDSFPVEDDKVKPKTKPLPTKWGKLEFDSCESHAKKDPTIKDPGGYCGSIQSHAEKATKIPVGEKVFSDTDDCISSMSQQDRIKNPEAYCGSRHNEEHGLNPNDESHKTSLSEEKPLEKPLEEVEKPCSCQHKAADPGTSRGVNMPSGLGAYNTTVNGSGQTDTITPEKLGDPDKLPKKPKDPTKPMASSKETSSTIFINPFIRNKSNNMTDKILEQISKTDEEESKKPEEETKAEDKVEAKEEDKKEENKALASINESLKAIAELIKSQNDKLDKAMEKPTDLPQSPKGTADKEDVGDKVVVPKDPYPQGEQSGIQDANGKVEDKPEDDKGDLKMQEKAIVRQTQVSRPNGLAAQEINKNTGKNDTFISYQVLQKARTLGSENLSVLGKQLLGLAENYDKEGQLEW